MLKVLKHFYKHSKKKKTQHVIDRYMKRSIEYDYFQSLQR